MKVISFDVTRNPSFVKALQLLRSGESDDKIHEQLRLREYAHALPTDVCANEEIFHLEAAKAWVISVQRLEEDYVECELIKEKKRISEEQKLEGQVKRNHLHLETRN